VRFGAKLNGLNKILPPPAWGIFFQRAGIDLGQDSDLPDAPSKNVLSLGFTWGPRIRSNLWFQELASVDVDGGIYTSSTNGETSAIGNAVMKVAAARVLSGRFIWNFDAHYMELDGEMSLNIRELLKGLVGDISFLGQARLSWPNGQHWRVEGDGTVTLLGSRSTVRLQWNDQRLGLCTASGMGIWYDGSGLGRGPCDYAGFAPAPSGIRSARPFGPSTARPTT
jgi:hypothetical protein